MLDLLALHRIEQDDSEQSQRGATVHGYKRINTVSPNLQQGTHRPLAPSFDDVVDTRGRSRSHLSASSQTEVGMVTAVICDSVRARR